MAHKQTRRSISVSLTTYSRLKAYCDATEQSMSGVTTRAVLAFLDIEELSADIEKDQSHLPSPEKVLASFHAAFAAPPPKDGPTSPPVLKDDGFRPNRFGMPGPVASILPNEIEPQPQVEPGAVFGSLDEDFYVPVRDPLPDPPKVVLPVESPEEFSKRFDKLREKNPYHVEVSRKLPKAEVILKPDPIPEPDPILLEPIPEMRRATSDMEKPELLRLQIENDKIKRMQSIRDAAERRAEAEKARAEADTAGGIFTF